MTLRFGDLIVAAWPPFKGNLVMNSIKYFPEQKHKERERQRVVAYPGTLQSNHRAELKLLGEESTIERIGTDVVWKSRCAAPAPDGKVMPWDRAELTLSGRRAKKV